LKEEKINCLVNLKADPRLPPPYVFPCLAWKHGNWVFTHCNGNWIFMPYENMRWEPREMWQLGFHALYENMRWEPREMWKHKTWELLKLTLQSGNSLRERPFAYEVRYTKIVLSVLRVCLHHILPSLRILYLLCVWCHGVCDCECVCQSPACRC